MNSPEDSSPQPPSPKNGERLTHTDGDADSNAVDIAALRGSGGGRHSFSSHPLQTLLILSVALIGVMGVSITLPILPKLAGVFHLSAPEVGLFITCFTLPSAFMTPVAGVLADRFGRKAILLPGLVFFVTGGIGCVFASTYSELLLCRAVQGLGAAPLGILYATLVGDLYDEKDRPGMMGLVGGAISLGTALYPAIGGLLGELDWRFPFWVSLAAVPVGLLALSVPLPPARSHMNWKQYAADSRTIICNPITIGLFFLTFLCFCILYGPTVTSFPLLAAQVYDASPALIGGVFMGASGGAALAALNMARLAHRYPHRHLMLAAAFAYCLAQVLMLAIAASTAGLHWAVWLLVLPLLLGGIGQGLTFPLLSSRLTSLAPGENRAIVMSMNGTVLRLSQSIAPVAFGLAWNWIGWPGPYLLGACIALLIGVVAVRLYPR